MACPHGQPTIESCFKCRTEAEKRGTCSMQRPRCYCGAEPTAAKPGGTPIAWACGTKLDSYGTLRRVPACIIAAGHDAGPQPDACPWCGARNTRQTWERWTYACGSHVQRNAQYPRHASQDMSDLCLSNVLAELERLRSIVHAQ